MPRLKCVVRYGSETRPLPNAKQNMLDLFQRNCLRIASDAHLKERASVIISFMEKISHSKDTMKDRLTWLRHLFTGEARFLKFKKA